MWSQKKRLALLNDELGSIDIIDRLLQYTSDSAFEAENQAVRRVRREEILAEIARLKAERSWWNDHATGFSIALLLCAATAYATFRMFVR